MSEPTPQEKADAINAFDNFINQDQPEPKPMAQPLSAIKIIHERPPNFEAIHAVFPGASGEGVIFAYGDTIYNPSGQALPQSLLDHERVHCERQLEIGVDRWWNTYLFDGEFRYNEELLAHQAEWQAVQRDGSLSRPQRRDQLKQIAKRLSGPLYGRRVSFEQAKRDIKNGK